MQTSIQIAQADPWQPYGKGNGKHSPVPEPGVYGLIFLTISLAMLGFRKLK